MLNLGEQIANYRKNLKYSQEELSQFSGISLRTIQRIEKGAVSPRGYTLRALAKSLKIDLNDLKTERVSPDVEIAKKVRILNTLGLLVILFPLLSTLFQVIYWNKNKHLLASHSPSKKVVSFQILWGIVVLISMSLIQILTYIITSQSVYGHFPIRMTVYVILLLTNIFVIVHSAIKLNKNSTVLLHRVPSLI